MSYLTASLPSAHPLSCRTPQGRTELLLPMPSRHNVMNALAAASCGVALGMEPAQIAIGISRSEVASGRLDWKQTTQGARLLDDSYNANPSSLRAGLELLAQLPGRRWLVLGNMAELGSAAAQLPDRKSVVSGKSVSVCVDLGGRRIIKQKQYDLPDTVNAQITEIK